jgi:hypothetical protein
VEPARTRFLRVLGALARERKRNGSYDWGVFGDVAEPGHFLETFLVELWLKHLRQHERVTKVDRLIENKVHHLLRSPPAHLISSEAQEIS